MIKCGHLLLNLGSEMIILQLSSRQIYKFIFYDGTLDKTIFIAMELISNLMFDVRVLKKSAPPPQQ